MMLPIQLSSLRSLLSLILLGLWVCTTAQANHYLSVAHCTASVRPPSRQGLHHATSRPTRHTTADHDVRLVSTSAAAAAPRPTLISTLIRGACLRIASDLCGGTVFENIKTRVTTSRDDENMFTATRNIVADGGGIASLWSGSSTRVVEGALVGAVFMLGSTLTRRRLRALGAPPTWTALGGGLVGGFGQALVMTPAGMIFTSLNVRRTAGDTDGNAWTVTGRVFRERGGWKGLYSGFTPMALRQASNWASRAGLTEVARSVLGLHRYGLYGEIGSGILGGVGSCWNTPIETVRVLTQRDISVGRPTKSISGYWREIYARDGFTGLFRGVSPRALQAIWQTCFLVVVPNLMGI